MPKYELQLEVTVKTPELKNETEALAIAEKLLSKDGMDVLIYYSNIRVFKRKLKSIKERKPYVRKKRKRRI